MRCPARRGTFALPLTQRLSNVGEAMETKKNKRNVSQTPTAACRPECRAETVYKNFNIG
jgi:hypothetical protein